MSDFDIVPTEAVHPRRLGDRRRSNDFYANRPVMIEQSDEGDSVDEAPRGGASRGLLDLVPEEFRAQFAGFDDDFFQASGDDADGHTSVDSAIDVAPAPAPVQQAPVQQAPVQQPARRPGMFRRFGNFVSRSAGRIAGGVRNAWRSLFGRGGAAGAAVAGAQVPAARAQAMAPQAFDYEDADMQRMMPGLGRVRRDVDVSRLNPMVPGLAPDVRVAPEDDPYDIVAQNAREREAAIALMHQHMARQGQARRQSPAKDVSGHVSSQSNLDAAFDAMQDDEAEDLLGSGPQGTLASPGIVPAPVGPAAKKEQTRASFLREGDEMWNNMRDDDADVVAHARPDAFDDERVDVDVEQDGGLDEDLQNIPPDMRDFPGADILYEPQRFRMKN